jgi:hypothetical protein
MNFSWVNFDNPVAIWWVFLTLASIVNIIAWSWTRVYLYKGVSFKNFNPFKLSEENLIWFSAFYVFGCAYRSFFTKADVQRICLFDSWFSSVFLGRSVATIAEIAFVIQWAIILRFLASSTKDQFSRTISFIIVPIIIIAECFSWYAVISTNYFGNMIEESLWTVAYALIMFALIKLRTKFKGALLYAFNISIFSCFCYILFMIFVDVHMYFNRWTLDSKLSKNYFTFTEGIIDLNTRWVVTHDIGIWKTEIPWMSLYFSFAVIVSILLCYVPLKKQRLLTHMK